MLAAVLMLCLLSLTGIPPTAGFIAKIYIFNSAVQAGEQWLIVLVAVAVVNTAVSAYYYLRLARTMLVDDAKDEMTFRPTLSMQVVLVFAAVTVIFVGLVPAPLISAAQRAAETLQIQ